MINMPSASARIYVYALGLIVAFCAGAWVGYQPGAVRAERAERALAMARFEHIEVDAHMAVKKALFVEARFARGRQTYKQNQFHARVCATFV